MIRHDDKNSSSLELEFKKKKGIILGLFGAFLSPWRGISWEHRWRVRGSNAGEVKCRPSLKEVKGQITLPGKTQGKGKELAVTLLVPSISPHKKRAPQAHSFHPSPLPFFLVCESPLCQHPESQQ